MKGITGLINKLENVRLEYYNMKKEQMEYIAFEGSVYTIEWYYNETNRSDVLEDFEELSNGDKKNLLMLFERMGNDGVISNKTKFRNEGDEIWAFKPKQGRFLCFFHVGKKIIVLSSYKKQGDKLPKKEKKKAENRRADYIARVKKGDYYG